MIDPQARIRFAAGTLVVEALPDGIADDAGAVWDPRQACHRLPASQYAALIRALHRHGLPYEDEARAYATLTLRCDTLATPRDYQQGAVDAWEGAQRRGVIVLPTGAGKTLVALLAIAQVQRSAMILAPTLELVRQWHGLLTQHFAMPIGVLGGGEHRPEAITVSTYDSAYLHMEHLGHRFGMLVFDECHHLPSDAYASAARMAIAPFRLGLTATPERADGREDAYQTLVGPIVFRREIVDLSGEYLADYQVFREAIAMSAEERVAYEEARHTYLAFVRAQGISMGTPDAWGRFLAASQRSYTGREAFAAYLAQRRIAFQSSAKMNRLAEIVHQHRRDRMIIFTQDNESAYLIARRCLLPIITHQTKTPERADILRKFSEGSLRGIVTSKVLNEGIDVPLANVAVVVSGSGSVREHVQRLGRILRQGKNKHAKLYELVTAESSEAWTSERRRDHLAYR